MYACFAFYVLFVVLLSQSNFFRFPFAQTHAQHLSILRNAIAFHRYNLWKN